MSFVSTSAPRTLRWTNNRTACVTRRPRTHVGQVRRVRITGCATATPSTEESYETAKLISDSGELAPGVGAGVVGVFAILDEEDSVRHVGISRDVATSLARCLVRQPKVAEKYRIARFKRPSRAALETVRSAWAASATDSAGEWEAIDVMTDKRVSAATLAKIEGSETGSERTRALKGACREVQSVVEDVLKQRGLTERIKFAPKLKEKGILDVQSVKIAVPEAI